MKYLIHHLLSEGNRLLKQAELPEIESRYFLEYILKKPFATILSELNQEVEETVYQSFLEVIRERIKGVPLQHITHKQNFMGYDFFVDEHVLIPRPETESLVEMAMAFFENKKGHFNVMDLCSGSGCIGISLLLLVDKMVDITLYGIDYSMEALRVSKKNENILLGSKKIHWIHSDLFDQYSGPKLDMIVSNPPYISPSDIEELDSVVKDYEPRMALDGGADGLDFYRRIVEKAYDELDEQGILLFEIGHGQMNAIISLMRDRGFEKVEGHRDYNGLERIVIGKR